MTASVQVSLAHCRARWQKSAMPLQWTIDTKDRLVKAVAEGNVVRTEIERLLEDMVGAGALLYRKLFDGSRGDTTMGPDDLMALGVLIRGLHHKHKVGPLAVVVPHDKFDLISRVLGMLAAADRPMRVFDDPESATRWIESQPG